MTPQTEPNNAPHTADNTRHVYVTPQNLRRFKEELEKTIPGKRKLSILPVLQSGCISIGSMPGMMYRWDYRIRIPARIGRVNEFDLSTVFPDGLPSDYGIIDLDVIQKHGGDIFYDRSNNTLVADFSNVPIDPNNQGPKGWPGVYLQVNRPGRYARIDTDGKLVVIEILETNVVSRPPKGAPPPVSFWSYEYMKDAYTSYIETWDIRDRLDVRLQFQRRVRRIVRASQANGTPYRKPYAKKRMWANMRSEHLRNCRGIIRVRQKWFVCRGWSTWSYYWVYFDPVHHKWSIKKVR